MGIETFKTFMAGVGSAAGIDDLTVDDSGFCAVEIDGMLCNLQYIFDTHGVYFFGELGEIPENLLGKLAPDFLAANLFGLETGGGSLALEPESRQLIFGHSISLENMDAIRFEQILGNCVNYMEHWKKELADRIAAKSNDSTPLGGYGYTHIRG